MADKQLLERIRALTVEQKRELIDALRDGEPTTDPKVADLLATIEALDGRVKALEGKAELTAPEKRSWWARVLDGE